MNPRDVTKCRFCGHEGYVHVVAMDSGPHYAKAYCQACERFLGWISKPDSDKSRRPAAHRELVAKYGDRLHRLYGDRLPVELGERFCELCLRNESKLPKNQTLEAHHIIEYQDGGTNDSEAIQIVCTRCHKLIHWLRTYA